MLQEKANWEILHTTIISSIINKCNFISVNQAQILIFICLFTSSGGITFHLCQLAVSTSVVVTVTASNTGNIILL